MSLIRARFTREDLPRINTNGRTAISGTRLDDDPRYSTLPHWGRLNWQSTKGRGRGQAIADSAVAFAGGEKNARRLVHVPTQTARHLIRPGRFTQFMRILAIETIDQSGSVAALEGDRPLAFRKLDA